MNAPTALPPLSPTTTLRSPKGASAGSGGKNDMNGGAIAGMVVGMLVVGVLVVVIIRRVRSGATTVVGLIIPRLRSPATVQYDNQVHVINQEDKN